MGKKTLAESLIEFAERVNIDLNVAREKKKIVKQMLKDHTPEELAMWLVGNMESFVTMEIEVSKLEIKLEDMKKDRTDGKESGS